MQTVTVRQGITGASCNHIAVMLYALVDITSKKDSGELSSTSQACKWNRPRKRRLSPKKAENIKFQRFEWKKTKRIPGSLRVARKQAAPAPMIGITKPRNRLTAEYPLAGFLLNFPKAQEDKENIQLPELHSINFMYIDTVNLQSNECCQQFEKYFSSLSVSDEEAKQVEISTIGQSSNSAWSDCRTGRLTSSNFGLIVKRKPDTRPDNLLKVLLNYTPKCQTSRSLMSTMKNSFSIFPAFHI
ncbi:hypothetical protein LOTGIDRAFT_163051 [Lottia gigantea]|uniref:Uncharacterized protein n=1 Tax=Lottia gigantea TaxID=225164 RepID=V4A5R1_LOTGI|nr:hypothetical protein LOTGIDRAFT_163051 [Lottia gigantea]ESO92047.1 hypothetical protein LOTGIDRAFT_163051 [Lottia gigantea]